MIKMLDRILNRAGDWPEAAQQELARAAADIERRYFRSAKYHATDVELAVIDEGLAQADRGEFVSDEDMAAFFERHGI